MKSFVFVKLIQVQCKFTVYCSVIEKIRKKYILELIKKMIRIEFVLT